jgi:tripartite-type tricarboxylate transporter receptor subunit TctC
MSRMPIVCGVLLAAAVHASASQAQTAESFYSNKQISLIVGYNPGGTYDIYSRIASTWLPRYIPGNPRIIVRNMPGAGGAKAANFLYQQGSKDGLTIGMISQAAALQQVIQDPAVDYDVRKFTWLGRMTPVVEVTAVWHTSPVKTLQDATKRETVLAATAAGATSSIMPNVMNQIVGTKFKITKGYPGTTGAMLAMERGEVEGSHATAENLVIGKPDWLRDKKISVLVQYAQERHPAFLDAPTMVEFGTTDQDKQVLALFGSTAEIGRSLVAPPGVPDDRLDVLRKAFVSMINDPAFKEELEKRNMEFGPMSGEELQKRVAQTVEVPQEVAKRAIALQGTPSE